jgi:hypothetical protein
MTNVQQLIIERAAQLWVEKLRAAADPEVVAQEEMGHGVGNILVDARTWTDTTLAACRLAPGSQEWPDDEAMAGEILRALAARSAVQGKHYEEGCM